MKTNACRYFYVGVYKLSINQNFINPTKDKRN